jgi:hypothetical protein
MSGGSIGRFNVFGQRIDRNGAKVAGEFEINTFTTINGNRAFPEVATNAAGDVVVVVPIGGAADRRHQGLQGQQGRRVPAVVDVLPLGRRFGLQSRRR